MSKPAKLVLRTPQFQKRLLAACDGSSLCPPLHKGRLTWIRDELAKMNVVVTVESVRRWLSGEGRPRQDKCEVLAQILGVDPVELYMGSKDAGDAQRAPANTPSVCPSEATTLPVALQADLVVTISGLPFDLTRVEAMKVANIVLAHAPEASDKLAR